MKRKIYEPVREFERATSYCPLYLAWRILDEARDYFRTELIPSPGSGTRKRHLIRPADTFSPSDAEKACLMSEELADKLARRAEAVFAHHPFWARKAAPRTRSRRFQNHEFILMFMRHWLAGVLAKERPALFRDLPENFKVGHPLPETPHHESRSSGRESAPSFHRRSQSRFTSAATVPKAERENHRPRFVHGCELLPA